VHASTPGIVMMIARRLARQAGRRVPTDLMGRVGLRSARAVPAVAFVTAADAAIILYTSGDGRSKASSAQQSRGAGRSPSSVTEAMQSGVLAFHAWRNGELPLPRRPRVVFLDGQLVEPVSAISRGITILRALQFYLITSGSQAGPRRGTIARLVLRAEMDNVRLAIERASTRQADLARAHHLGDRTLVCVRRIQIRSAIARDLYGAGFTNLQRLRADGDVRRRHDRRPGDRQIESVASPSRGGAAHPQARREVDRRRCRCFRQCERREVLIRGRS
jgi:hypothetical protein